MTTVIFSANDGVHGDELFISNGTEAGTVLLKDINPGSAGSAASQFTLVNGRTIFLATTDANGRELWVTDGTETGTKLLLDTKPGAQGGDIGAFFLVGDKAFFTAEGIKGRELYVTDGTSAGTRMVKDLAPGITGSYPQVMGVLDGKLIFQAPFGSLAHVYASDGTAAGTVMLGAGPATTGLVIGGQMFFRSGNPGTNDARLWVTDGTVAGTHVAGTIAPAIDVYGFSAANLFGDRLLFKGADNGLWISDGTDAGTVRLATNSDLGVSFGDKRVFAGPSGDPWITDGTVAGTVQLKDITPNDLNAQSGDFHVLGGKLVFEATDAINGRELWVTNGTAGGTLLLKDINPGLVSGNAGQNGGFNLVGDKLVFTATTAANGTELWVTDGTPAGTKLLKDIIPGAESGAAPTEFHAIGGKLVFTASTTAEGREVWVTDGTAAGTKLLKDIMPGAFSSAADDFHLVGGKLVFTANDGQHGRELWVTDGTNAGTQLLVDSIPGVSNGAFTGFSLVDGVLYYSALTDKGVELWRTDGTTAGTHAVADINPAQTEAELVNTGLGQLGDHYVFVAFNTVTNDGALMATDGAGGPAVKLGDLQDFTAVASIDGKLYIAVAQSGETSRLWVTDGTVAGTHVIDVPVSGSSIVNIGGKAVFLGQGTGPAGTGVTFWATDGTASGAHQLAPAQGGNPPEIVGSPSQAGLFFTTDNADVAGIKDLWFTDGSAAAVNLGATMDGVWPVSLGNGSYLFTGWNSTTHLPQVRITDGAVSGTHDLPYMGGFTGQSGERLFFSQAISTSEGFRQQLFSTDLTGGDVVTIFDLPQSSSGILGVMGGVTGGREGPDYFTTGDSDGVHLWASDGTVAGTVKLADVSPTTYAVKNGAVFFGGSTAVFNGQPAGFWFTDGTAAGTRKLADGTVTGRISYIDGRALVVLNSAASGQELWVSDGTVAGTSLLKDINPGVVGGGVKTLTVVGSHAVFVANDGVHGDELWVTDGTSAGTQRFAGVSLLSTPRLVNGALYFIASSSADGSEIWTSDGTVAGTHVAFQLAPGAASLDPRNLAVVGDRLTFTAVDPVKGREVWISDGTAAGTHRVTDTTTPGSSNPGHPVVLPGPVATTGNDVLTGTATGDAIDGLAGNDTLRGDAGDDRLDGGEGDDKLYGGAGADTLNGGAGLDFLYGEAGDDVLNGGDGPDRMYGGEGADTLNGGAGLDLLYGGDGNDVLNGDADNDRLYGEAGDDQLNGGLGADILDGGAGDDVMAGGLGNDVYYVDSAGDQVIELVGGGTDTVRASVSFVLGANLEALVLEGTADLNGTGNSQNNTLTGNGGANVLDGGDGADVLNGGAGNDTLLGGAGVDRLDGGDGDDVLTGGAGNDTLTGGLGADRFVITQDSLGGTALETDTIKDFNAAQGDIIDLSGIDANSLVEGDQTFGLVTAFTKAAGQMTLTYVAAQDVTLLRLDVNGDGKADYQLRLNGDVHDTTGWLL